MKTHGLFYKKHRFNSSIMYCFFIFLLITLLINSSAIVSAENNKMVSLQVRRADIQDVLLMLTEQSGINLVPDESVTGTVTLELKNVGVQEALKTLTTAYGYEFNQISENIYMVSRNEFSKPPEIEYENGLLSIKVERGDIQDVLNIISEKAGINIVVDRAVSGVVSANLNDVPLDRALMNFLQANGFSLSKSRDLYRVFMSGEQGSPHNLAVSVVNGKVSIDVQQANLTNVLNTIARVADIDMVIFGGVRGTVDLKINDVPLREAIDLVLSGTRYTYRCVNDVYMIGDKNISSPGSELLTMNELIPLEYLKVEKVQQLLPNNFPASNVKVIKEKNAFMVTGTPAEVEALKEYIKQIDVEIPQIVVEALIVDLNRTQNESLGINLGLKEDEEGGSVIYDSPLGKLTYNSIMDLPDNFFVQVEALVSEGKANIKARPNITTLNGQEARIDVGTVQYYKVTNTNQEGETESSYNSVNAGVTLEVTPWVSSSGEITMDLRPTVSNISSRVGDGPPQVNRREASTTVRVKDGQTIVIGGLIQDVATASTDKIPILGDLPLLGALFRSTNSDVHQTEMVIYITPHVLRPEEEDTEAEVEAMLEKALDIKK